MDNLIQAVDLALGRGGQPPPPFFTGLSEVERVAALRALTGEDRRQCVKRKTLDERKD